MTKIQIEIKSCSDCPHFKASLYPTADSFERPEYWWCMNSDEIAPNAEETRLFLKEDCRLDKLRYIAGYVEWTDKISIPEWCPCKINKPKKKTI
jgi:hypothetical protein